MERAKEDLHIEDYSVSQTTLEQVFLNFARGQKNPIKQEVTCYSKSMKACRYFCCCGCCKTGSSDDAVPASHVVQSTDL